MKHIRQKITFLQKGGFYFMGKHYTDYERYEQVFNSNPHPTSKLNEAINCTKECQGDLFTFFDDGHVEITNNTAERTVKPFVVQRKVFQTSGSYSGASITTKLFSIIQTVVINNLNVEKYLNYVFENINKEPIENLLSYSKNIKDRLKQELNSHLAEIGGLKKDNLMIIAANYNV